MRREQSIQCERAERGRQSNQNVVVLTTALRARTQPASLFPARPAPPRAGKVADPRDAVQHRRLAATTSGSERVLGDRTPRIGGSTSPSSTSYADDTGAVSERGWSGFLLVRSTKSTLRFFSARAAPGSPRSWSFQRHPSVDDREPRHRDGRVSRSTSLRHRRRIGESTTSGD